MGEAEQRRRALGRQLREALATSTELTDEEQKQKLRKVRERRQKKRVVAAAKHGGGGPVAMGADADLPLEELSERMGMAALSAVIMADVDQGKCLSHERLVLLRGLASSDEVGEGKLLSADDMDNLEYAEGIWNVHASAALRQLRSTSATHGHQLLREKFSKYLRAQKREAQIAQLDAQAIAAATEEHAAAMRQWRRVEASRQEIAEWKGGLQDEFADAMSHMHELGIDPFELQRRH